MNTITITEDQAYMLLTAIYSNVEATNKAMTLTLGQDQVNDLVSLLHQVTDTTPSDF